MSKISFEVQVGTPPAETKVLFHKLSEFNSSRFGPSARQEFSVLVKDKEGELRGGASGNISWNWLYIQLLWVDEALRGEGLGRKILEEVQALATKMHCQGMWVDTFSPDAQCFYEKFGFTEVGKIQDFPPGHCRVFLKKSL